MTYILGHVIILESSVTPECSFHVIMFVGPLGDARPSETCVAYIKRNVVGVGPWEASGVFSTQRTKATQQDLCNHILVHRSNGIGYVPHSSTPESAIYEPCSPSHFVTSGSA